MSASALPHMTASVMTLRFHDRLFRAGLGDIEAGHWENRPAEDANHLAFQFTHLLDARHYLAKLVDFETHNPLPEGVREARKVEDVKEWPGAEALLAGWTSLAEPLAMHCEQLSGEFLMEPKETKLPMPGGNRLAVFTFLVHHEAYHLGQIGQTRRELGLPPLMSRLFA